MAAGGAFMGSRMAQRGPTQTQRLVGGNWSLWGAARSRGGSCTHSILEADSVQSPSLGSFSVSMPQVFHDRTWHLFFDHLWALWHVKEMGYL